MTGEEAFILGMIFFMVILFLPFPLIYKRDKRRMLEWGIMFQGDLDEVGIDTPWANTHKRGNTNLKPTTSIRAKYGPRLMEIELKKMELE